MESVLLVMVDFYLGAFFICYVISITHAQLTHVIIQSCGQPLNKIDDLFKAALWQKPKPKTQIQIQIQTQTQTLWRQLMPFLQVGWVPLNFILHFALHRMKNEPTAGVEQLKSVSTETEYKAPNHSRKYNPPLSSHIHRPHAHFNAIRILRYDWWTAWIFWLACRSFIAEIFRVPSPFPFPSLAQNEAAYILRQPQISWDCLRQTKTANKFRSC